MALLVLPTPIAGLLLLKPTVFKDARGWFYEAFNEESFEEATGLDVQFVQDNLSHSVVGTIRGLHYQMAPFAQAKIVSVLMGRIRDVVVDLRAESPTFGKTYILELQAAEPNLLYIPEGFAHGFATLSPEGALVSYKCSRPYAAHAERGLRWDDAALGIDWGIQSPIVSAKDAMLPTLADTLVGVRLS